MIQLTCTNCRATLDIDEAFAGGVCRCQHCGTIQTVPAHLKGGTASAAPGTGRTLYRNRATATGGKLPGTGLDDLADAVTSSGLSGSGLQSNRLRASTPPQQSRLKLIIAGFSAIVVVLLVVVIILATRRDDPSTITSAPGTSRQPDGSDPTVAPKPTGPVFADIPITGNCVVYVLDRGDSAREFFGDLKQATYKSIASLGSDRKFQVVFWNNGSDDGYPVGGPTYATADNVDACRRAFADLAAHGATDVTSAISRAKSANPSDVVLVTAKGWDLDETFVAKVASLRGTSAFRVHTVALGDPGSSTALKKLAEQTGGQYRVIGAGELRTFGE